MDRRVQERSDDYLMRLKATSKHKISPERVAISKVMSGKLNHSNAVAIATALGDKGTAHEQLVQSLRKVPKK